MQKKHIQLDSGAFVTDSISQEQGRRLILDVDALETDGGVLTLDLNTLRIMMSETDTYVGSGPFIYITDAE